MESDAFRSELLAPERAAAAPYVLKPLHQWWHAALLSLAGPLFALVTSETLRAFEGGGTWAFLPGIAITLLTILVMVDHRKRRGVTPRGKAPLELRAVFRWYYVGAALVLVGIAVLAMNTSPWLSLPVSYVACLGGLMWFGAAYERAAARVRARLA